MGVGSKGRVHAIDMHAMFDGTIFKQYFNDICFAHIAEALKTSKRSSPFPQKKLTIGCIFPGDFRGFAEAL